MNFKKIIKKLLLITVLTFVVYNLFYNFNVDKFTNNVIAYTHYYKNAKSQNYKRINIKGVSVFVSKDLSGDEKEKISYALNNATKTLTDKELRELKMIVYTPVNKLPEYLQRDENISRNVSNNMTEGFYVPSLKEIYIFPDVIEKDSSFDQQDVMLFVTMHEIGHHIDLTVTNHVKDLNAEKRASMLAFKKIDSAGIKLDENVEDSIINSR